MDRRAVRHLLLGSRTRQTARRVQAPDSDSRDGPGLFRRHEADDRRGDGLWRPGPQAFGGESRRRPHPPGRRSLDHGCICPRWKIRRRGNRLLGRVRLVVQGRDAGETTRVSSATRRYHVDNLFTRWQTVDLCLPRRGMLSLGRCHGGKGVQSDRNRSAARRDGRLVLCGARPVRGRSAPGRTFRPQKSGGRSAPTRLGHGQRRRTFFQHRAQ